MIIRDPFDVTGKGVLITGASRGIGYAIARAFLEGGSTVLVSGRDAEETRNAVQALAREFGEARVHASAGDVSDPAYARDLVDAAVGRLDCLDAVVCNAGTDTIKPAVDYTPDEWERILGVNLRGAFLVAQAAARHWIARGQSDASVTMTSSIAGSVGIPSLAPYAASKGGMNQLVRTLAVEWAQYGIRVNAVAPGYVDNIMAGVTVHADPASEDRIRRFTPMGRRATVDEIAAPFVFLASRAAGYITGAILAVDGGYTSV